MSALDYYREDPFEWGGHKLRIFSRGVGPGVILMHELPGLSPSTVDLADFLVSHGFHVVMPLLFGTPLQNPVVGMVKAPLLCIRKEFNLLRAGRPSPITDALRGLCAHVHARCGGRGVGAIGMCLSGGFILTMMLEPSLLAPVMAQPSLPFLKPTDLDVAPEVLETVIQRAEVAPVLGLRFSRDLLSPKQRMDRLENAFGGAPCFQRLEIPGCAHSTLTAGQKAGSSQPGVARQRVLSHLRRQLLA